METFLEIPWGQNIDSFVQDIILNQEIFKIQGFWNHSYNFWTLDLLDKDDDPIFLGQKVVLGVDFLKRITKLNKPAGSLLFVGNNKQIEGIQKNDIPLKARFLYVY